MPSVEAVERLELIERLEVMTRKESTSYKGFDYLSPEWQRQIKTGHDENPQSIASSDSSSSRVEETWRTQICHWCYQVVDHFKFNREVASVAMSYLDRYLAKNPVNRTIFQLVAMTSLHLAIKLNEPRKLEMASLINLSRGYFTVDHMVSMEESLLLHLDWLVHPPTPNSFVRELMAFLPDDDDGMDPRLRHYVVERAHFLTELSVCDYYFVTKKPSSIAMAAVIIALDVVTNNNGGSYHFKTRFVQNVMESGLDRITQDEETVDCFDRLNAIYVDGGFHSSTYEVEGEYDTEEEDVDKRLDTVSPASVFNAP